MVDGKTRWAGRIDAVQPRIRLTRSFDQLSHTYLESLLRVNGAIGHEEREFLVAIGKVAQEKHGFRIRDIISGESQPVRDSRLQVTEFYKTSKLRVMERAGTRPSAALAYGAAGWRLK